ncbi:hypothetical protein PG994_010018 [Apiospora phragmitis]|uniref:Uncharacterized protein n=1 Tax=Apiospora phragmitis TaxID=2905665 RepID=A0ABR1TRD7_9PEZI
MGESRSQPSATMEDPSTTLFTFLLRTHQSIQGVQLFGSLDNFSNPYKMERDARRSRGQWRGCHTFRDIVCDGDQSFISPKRTGGLRMGQTYYYYYEIDGSTETHDPAMPSTTSCPYLPGQTVNTLDVPTEHPSRHRSASMTSITAVEYRTMNPMDKFRSPRPAPAAPMAPSMARSLVSSSPSDALQIQRPSRSQSPTPRWVSARRLFGLKPSNRGSSADRSKGAAVHSDTDDMASVKSCHSNHSSQSYPSERNTRSTTPSGSSRSREMSPEALRRFLSDDKPVVTTPPVESNPGLSIPEQIMEENEDDDNFASHAAAEVAPSTLLSPPPFLRSFSSPSLTSCVNTSSDTIVPHQGPAAAETRSEHTAARHSSAFKLHIPKSRFSLSSSSSNISTTPFSATSSISRSSPSSRAASSSSYFGGDNDEDDDEEEEDEDDRRLSREDEKQLGKAQPFAGYSLPPQTTAEAGQKHHRDASVATQTAAGLSTTESPPVPRPQR